MSEPGSNWCAGRVRRTAKHGDGVCVVELPGRFADCLGQAAQLSLGRKPRCVPRCLLALCVACSTTRAKTSFIDQMFRYASQGLFANGRFGTPALDVKPTCFCWRALICSSAKWAHVVWKCLQLLHVALMRRDLLRRLTPG